MDRDFVIEKINAYRRLLDLTLKNVTKDEAVQKEVQVEFSSWVESQLAELMGTPSTTNLTEQEITFLKAFTKKLMAKPSEPQQQAQTQVKELPVSTQKNQISITDKDREMMARAKPLKESKAAKEADPLLRKLEEMDAMGPNF
jgi:hypothetical protein